MTSTAVLTRDAVEAPAVRTATAWRIDPGHSHVEFATRHLMIATVKGRFADVEGTIALDAADPTISRVEARIAAASVDTREPERDAHLRSADFFDVERHPYLTFASRRVEPVHLQRGQYRVVGDLTIRGVTREVALDLAYNGQAKDPWGVVRAGFCATTQLNRRDYGLTWNVALETGGVLVGDDVKVSLEVEAVQEPAQTQAA